MIERAQPLPKMPKYMNGPWLKLVVPVRLFAMTTSLTGDIAPPKRRLPKASLNQKAD
ncbi:MAG: hypothetical protein MEQ84_03435 [Mesorhizobium sp.]|nr:hypothetical protein [Mesorhizobium sp.]